MTCGVQRGDLEARTDLSSASCEFRTNSELMGMGGWATPSGDQVHRRSVIEP